MLKYGILGGTFDPVHNGHIHLAKYVKKQLNLDKVILIPAFSPPHKDRKNITAPNHRLKMLELAIQNENNLKASDIELNRKGKSFTIDTIKELKEKHPQVEFYFILGADMLHELHLWKDITKVIEEVNLVIATRPGNALTKDNISSIVDIALYPFIETLSKYIIELPPVDISSTEIRDAFTNSSPATNLDIPQEVKEYIIKNNLYRK